MPRESPRMPSNGAKRDLPRGLPAHAGRSPTSVSVGAERGLLRSLPAPAPADRRSASSVGAERDLLRALPQERLAELREVLVALDDRREVVARELARLGREVDVAVGQEDLGLRHAARIEHDLAG